MYWRPYIGSCHGPVGYLVAIAVLAVVVLIWRVSTLIFGTLPLFVGVHVALVVVVLLAGRLAGLFTLAVGTVVVLIWLSALGVAGDEWRRILANIVAGFFFIWAVGRAHDETLIARAEQERTQFLMRELEHRTGNLLMVISGLVRMSVRDEGDRDVLMDRIVSVGRINEVVDGHATVEQLFDAAVLKPFARSDQHRIEVHLDPLTLDGATAQPLGLALHELATNAMKHGALSNDVGRVHVCGTRYPARYSIAWIETGGPTPTRSHRDGAKGSSIIARAAKATGGKITTEWTRLGLHWKLEIPVQ